MGVGVSVIAVKVCYPVLLLRVCYLALLLFINRNHLYRDNKKILIMNTFSNLLSLSFLLDLYTGTKGWLHPAPSDIL